MSVWFIGFLNCWKNNQLEELSSENDFALRLSNHAEIRISREALGFEGANYKTNMADCQWENIDIETSTLIAM